MKFKAYIKICLSLILFFLTNTIVQAQKVPDIVKKESADSIYQKKSSSPTEVMVINKADSLFAEILTRACVSTFTNQTISSNVNVVGCNTLTVQNVTVTSGGILSLTSPGEITINGAFDVLSGGSLNVHFTAPPPPGNDIQNPIVIGSFGAPFQYSDTKNTSDYTNEYNGRSTNDVFYQFTITVSMNVTIKHCGSFGDTYLHLLNNEGTLIAYNDDYYGAGCCGNTSQSYLSQLLPAGTYYIVSEGYNSNGNIQTTVTGEIPQIIFNYGYDNSGNRISRNF